MVQAHVEMPTIEHPHRLVARWTATTRAERRSLQKHSRHRWEISAGTSPTHRLESDRYAISAARPSILRPQLTKHVDLVMVWPASAVPVAGVPVLLLADVLLHRAVLLRGAGPAQRMPVTPRHQIGSVTDRIGTRSAIDVAADRVLLGHRCSSRRRILPRSPLHYQTVCRAPPAGPERLPGNR